MLTILKIRVASGNTAAARRAAEYVLAAGDSPEALDRARSTAETLAGATHAGDGSGKQPSAVWLGSPTMLAQLGVERLAEISLEQLALALQGRHAVTGDRVRTEGMIHRYEVDDRGRPVYDEDGRRRKVRVHGTKTVDLTFSAPKSVSVVWSQAGPELRGEIEAAMLAAADAMLETMTHTKPVVPFRRVLYPARGFAAAAALHVMARAAQGETVPSPQLHVHGIVVGVERDDGFFASPELSGMFKYGAPLEGGAVARAKLAEHLVGMGFEIVNEGRFFEIRGVPEGLVKRMSGRTRDVEKRIGKREAVKGKKLTNRERAVAALETRAPKSHEATLEEIIAQWAAHASEFDFDEQAVEALRSPRGFSGSAEERLAAVSATVLDRMDADASIGARRAIVFECAAGRLPLDEARPLLDQIAA